MWEHARSMSTDPSSESVPIGFHYPVFTKMRDLLTNLQHEIKPRPEHTLEHIAHVSDVIANSKLEKQEWEQFVAFTEKGYTRHLLAHDENFTVLLLCWNKGQKSPIHDHAGSSCWVKCLDGQLRERRFVHEDGQEGALVETADATLSAGQVCYMSDESGYHEMANPNPEACTVTMHIYCPPFYDCHALELSGAKRAVSMLAATAPVRDTVSQSCGAHDATDDDNVPRRSDAVSLIDFVTTLNDHPTNKDDVAAVTAAYSRLHFNKEEWLTYAHFSNFRFQRLLIHKSDNYTLLMLCWLPGQATPEHDHQGSQSWVRVLSGELTLDVVDGPEAGKSTVLKKGSDVFAEDASLATHVLGNRGTEYAVSLHLYNPPYTELHYGSTTAEAHPDHLSSGEQSPTGDSMGTTPQPQCKTLPVVQCQRFESTTANSSMTSNNTSLGRRSLPSCHISNFLVLLEKLQAIMEDPVLCKDQNSLSVAAMNAMETTHFCPQEIDRYWKSKGNTGLRVRLFENVSFNIVLNLWEAGQHSVPHDHDGSFVWMKVLSGTMHDLSYEVVDGKASVTRNSRMRSGDACYYAPTAIHALRNNSKAQATTLHVYAVPNKACRWFTQTAERPITVSSQTVMTKEWGPEKDTPCCDGDENASV